MIKNRRRNNTIIMKKCFFNNNYDKTFNVKLKGKCYFAK